MGSNKIGRAIAYLRKQKHLTQSELAAQLHITDKAVSKWERGLAVPDALLLPRLSLALDTDIESILSGSLTHSDLRWMGLLVLEESPAVYAGTYLCSQPLVYFLIGYFLLVGIQDIAVVCSKQSEAFLTAEKLPLHLSFYRSEKDAVLDADGVMKVSGNPFLYGSDLTKYFQRAMAQITLYGKDEVQLLLPNCSGMGKYVLGDSGELCAAETGEAFGMTYDCCPISFYRCGEQNGSCGGVKIGRGMLYTSVTDAPTLMLASEAVQMIERMSGTRIYDLSEILRRRGIEKD